MERLLTLFKPGARLSAPAKWVLVAFIGFGLIAFTGKRQQQRAIPEILVNIAEQKGLHFVDERDVYEHVQGQILQDIKLQGSGNVQLGRLERMLERNPYIAKADIWQDYLGRISVHIDQTRPIARIVGLGEGDSYVTQEGKVLSVSPLYTARVLLMEGPGARALRTSLPLQDSAAKGYLDLIRFLEADQFWSAQASSLYIAQNGDVTVIPQIGNQRIELGGPTDLSSKFERLAAFYERILPAKGWARYSQVSVKYSNQIICQ